MKTHEESEYVIIIVVQGRSNIAEIGYLNNFILHKHLDINTQYFK